MQHKYEMGIVGNCAFIAHIDKKSAIRWLCWPKFDSSFVFGSLIDESKGGNFQIYSNSKEIEYVQYYIDNTNILSTEFRCSDGRFRVIDFAPRFQNLSRFFRPLMLIRKIELLEGNPSIQIICNPVYDYGNTQLNKIYGSNHIDYVDNHNNNFRLTTTIPLSFILDQNKFILTETKYLVFTYGAIFDAPIESTVEEFLKSTKTYWINWIKTTFIPNFHQKFIIRSALALKLHQYEDTGGIIASSTTSLPEINHGNRNWDYRYCWMRDSYYTLLSFNSMGHFEELEKYFRFIENIIHQEQTKIQPLYSITSNNLLVERELPLSGYLSSNRPVRIGNDAYTHIQNDVYGQVLVSLLPLYIDNRFANNSEFNQDIVIKLVKFIEKTIDEPDAGIWEFRNNKLQHCYTALFQWAGAKAAKKIALKFKDGNLKKLATRLEKKATLIIEACYDPKQKFYSQSINSSVFDASCLQLITMNYLNPKSNRAKLHLKAIEKNLVTKDGLVYRYKHEDDFGIPKNTFMICSFWYVEALACIGRLGDAIKTFEKLLKYTNHLGLLSEDVSEDGSQWGNFPQTYSHVGLMNAAFRISRKVDHPIFF